MASAIRVHVDQEGFNNLNRREARLVAGRAIADVTAAMEERDCEIKRRREEEQEGKE
jgi:hypothetical protein